MKKIFEGRVNLKAPGCATAYIYNTYIVRYMEIYENMSKLKQISETWAGTVIIL